MVVSSVKGSIYFISLKALESIEIVSFPPPHNHSDCLCTVSLKPITRQPEDSTVDTARLGCSAQISHGVQIITFFWVVIKCERS